MFRLDATTTIEITVEGDENTINQQEAPETFTVFTSTSATCRGWAYWGAERSANVTLSTASSTRISTTSGALVSPDGSWVLSDAATLTFDGDDDDPLATGYTFTFCFQAGELYNGVSLGQQVLIYLYNLTAGPSPFDSDNYAASSMIYNHTNPSFVGGSCNTIAVTGVRSQDSYGFYGLIRRTDGSSGSSILSASSYTLTVVPTACQGNTNNFNFTINFNDTNLCAGQEECEEVFNLTECAKCKESGFEISTETTINGTLTVDGTLTVNNTIEAEGDITSQETCHCKEISADAPSSSEPSIPLPCFLNGGSSGSCEQNNGDSSGGGGNGGGGGGSPIPPPIVPLGFIPVGVPIAVLPIVPIFPPMAVPIVTIPVGDVPISTGGIYIPAVNFSEEVPYCTNETDPRGDLAVVNTGIEPNRFSVCQVIDTAGTRGWQPYCPCSDVAFNATDYYGPNSTLTFFNESTLIISSDSQFISGGTNIVGSLDVCLEGSTNTTKTNYIEACSGNAVTFNDFVLAPGAVFCSGINQTTTDSIVSCRGDPVDFPNGISNAFSPAPFNWNGDMTIGGDVTIEGTLTYAGGTTYTVALVEGVEYFPPVCAQNIKLTAWGGGGGGGRGGLLATNSAGGGGGSAAYLVDAPLAGAYSDFSLQPPLRAQNISILLESAGIGGWGSNYTAGPDDGTAGSHTRIQVIKYQAQVGVTSTVIFDIFLGGGGGGGTGGNAADTAGAGGGGGNLGLDGNSATDITSGDAITITPPPGVPIFSPNTFDSGAGTPNADAQNGMFFSPFYLGSGGGHGSELANAAESGAGFFPGITEDTSNGGGGGAGSYGPGGNGGAGAVNGQASWGMDGIYGGGGGGGGQFLSGTVSGHGGRGGDGGGFVVYTCVTA